MKAKDIKVKPMNEGYSAKQTIYKAFISKNYKKIVAMVNRKAFLFHINAEDLLSQLNIYLARSLNKDGFEGNEREFWGYIATVVHNTAISVKRSVNLHSGRLVDIDDCVEIDSNNQANQPNLALKEFQKIVYAQVRESLKSQKHKDIFDEYFINDHSYEDISKILSLPIGTVKTTIFSIRNKAYDMFGEQYSEIIN